MQGEMALHGLRFRNSRRRCSEAFGEIFSANALSRCRPRRFLSNETLACHPHNLEPPMATSDAILTRLKQKAPAGFPLCAFTATASSPLLLSFIYESRPNNCDQPWQFRLRFTTELSSSTNHFGIRQTSRAPRYNPVACKRLSLVLRLPSSKPVALSIRSVP